MSLVNMRNLFYFMMAFNSIGNCMKLVLNFYSLLFGKLIVGVSAGTLLVVLGKCISDTIPIEVQQYYGVASNSGVCFGIFMVGIVQAAMLPIFEDGLDALKNDEMWRFAYGIQIILNLIVGELINIWLPSIQLKPLIDAGDEEAAKAMLKRIYVLNSDLEINECYAQKMKLAGDSGSSTGGSDGISTYEAFTSRKYRLASINSFFLGFLQQFTGISVLMIFSVQIFQDMKAKGDFSADIKTTVQLVNFANFFASFFGCFFMKKFGQKQTLLIGNHFIAACMWLITAFIFFKKSMGIIIMIMTMIISF